MTARTTRIMRWLVLAALVGAGAWNGVVAKADVNCVRGDEGDNECNNVQEGDNSSESEQRGSSRSGDAVAGQVTGVVSAGDSSVDATNRSEDVDVNSGDASASNTSTSYTGLISAEDVEIGTTADVNIEDSTVENAQEGDNESDFTQTANASTGDGVGGQVIGAVTAAGGTNDIVAANRSEDVDIDTGDADSNNEIAAFVGLVSADEVLIGADTADVNVEDSDVDNVQEGDNDATIDQLADSSSGDGVGGMVLGSVSAGDTSIDATNRSEDVDIETGDAESGNDTTLFVGQVAPAFELEDLLTGVADITIEDSDVANVLEGDNSDSVDQVARTASGDAVGGMVAGVVTAAGGSADLVLANTSVDVDLETGDTSFFNSVTKVTGQVAAAVVNVGGGIIEITTGMFPDC